MAKPDLEAGVHLHSSGRGGRYWDVGQLGKPLILNFEKEEPGIKRLTRQSKERVPFCC